MLIQWRNIFFTGYFLERSVDDFWWKMCYNRAMEESKIKLDDLLAKVAEARKGGVVDLSHDEDLAIAVANLIALEEHFYWTGAKTEKDEYYQVVDEIREMRKELMTKLLGEKPEGETWCASKHILSTMLRMIEVGTKLYHSGDKEQAKKMYERAHTLFSIFWGIRLNVIDLQKIAKPCSDEVCSLNPADENGEWTLKDITNKLVNCCKE